MNILYASNICSDKEFKKIFDMCKIKPMQSIQKFNKLLCNGLIENEKIKLDIITSAPINRKMCKKVLWKHKKENENGINYNYCFMINIPIIKFITLFFSSMYISINWCIKHKKEKIIIYDAYCPIIANMSAIIGQLFRCKIIALYTDVPKCMNNNLEHTNILKRLFKKLYNAIDKISNNMANGYILLTEQMNELVNKEKKPYTIIEGLADIKRNINNNIENKYKKFTILYAGGLYKKFGILNLIEAVEKIESDEVQLLLYGNGELENYLKEYKSDRVFYGGVVPNDEILMEEIKSTILVNPRFSNEEYTKYSFPSKNMEYMVSGTPVLTVKLSGIPKEYEKYNFFIEDESVDGIKKSIINLMLKDRSELYKFGMNAREFVIKNKNYYVQAKKIIKLMEEI